MSYLYIDDRFALHPKVAPLSDKAFRAHVLALCYCAGHLTDGELSTAAAKALAIQQRTALELVAANLWTQHEKGWKIHDYLDWQDTRDEVLARRENASKGGKARARGAKREGGRFTSEAAGTASGALVKGLVSAGPAGTSDAPASPSPSPSPNGKLALVPRGARREESRDRLAAAFEKLGCDDNQLFVELVSDDAIEVIVEIVEALAEKPGKPGASPASRIRNYLKGASVTLEDERTRVRGSRDRSPEEVRHPLNQAAGTRCERTCPICWSNGLPNLKFFPDGMMG
jgi:hypothetical protein